MNKPDNQIMQIADYVQELLVCENGGDNKDLAIRMLKENGLEELAELVYDYPDTDIFEKLQEIREHQK